MHIIFRRFQLYFLVALLLLSSFVAILTPMSASAAVGTVENPQDQLIRYLFYRGMRACLNDADFDGKPTDNQEISASDINEGHLNLQESRGIGFIAPSLEDGATTGTPSKGNDTDGTIDCNDGSIWVRGATLFGFANVLDLVCTMNTALSTQGALSKVDNDRIQPDKDGGPGRENCRASNKVYFDGGDSIFQEALTWALENGGDKNRPSADIDDNGSDTYDAEALRYLVGLRSLINFCGALSGNIDDMLYESDNFDGNKVVSVRYVGGDGKLDPRHAFSIGGKDQNSKWFDDERTEGTNITGVWYDGKTDNDARGMKCSTMAEWTRNYYQAYSKWALKYGDLAAANEDDIEAEPGGDPEAGGGTSTTSCGVEGIGWIICPVMGFMGKLNDAAFGFIDDFLYIETGLLTSVDTRAAWSNFRDIANIAFIIAFLIIVYSQITSAGVSNYGIKRMLPRLFIAAILVNLSYFICQAAVDISNILGSNLYSFFKEIPTTDSMTVAAEGMPSWQKVIAGILIATGAAAILLLAASAIGTAALLAFALVILILIARKALLIILVVVAPLAFVAYLLPNTEKWFKSWWKMFSTLLMVFPIVAVIFGASTLAARVINNAGGGETPDSGDQYLLQITALGVMALPLFAVPAVLKGAMSASGSLGTKLQGLADKAQGRAGAKSKDRIGKEFSDMGNRFTARAFNSTSRRGKLAKAVVGGRVKREDRYKQNQTLREAAQEDFLNQGVDPNDPTNTQGLSKTAQRRVAAGAAKKTADANNQLINNMGTSSSLHSNAALHSAVAESNKAVHHEEDLLKNRGETKYFDNPANAGHIAEGIAAQENRQASETNALNRAKTGMSPESVAARQAITASKASKGEEKLVDQGLEFDFQKSDVGRSQAQGLKVVEGELEIVHSEQKLAYEASDDGKDIEKAKLSLQSEIDTEQTNTKTDFTKSRRGKALSLDGAVAQAQLGAAEAANKARVDELKAGAKAAGVVGTTLEQVAVDLSAADIQTRAQTQRSASAQNVGNIEYARAVEKGTIIPDGTETLAQVAGGIAERGEAKALAAAKAVVTQETMKNIENIQSTMPFDVSSDPEELQRRFKSASSMEEKVAILKAMYTNGSPGVKATRETLTEWTKTGDPDEIQTIKEIMQSDQGFQRAGRDFEVWSNNEHAVTDAAGNQVPHATFGDVTSDSGVWADISAQRFASMNKSSQKQAFAELDATDPTGAMTESLIDRIYADSTARGQIKEEVLDRIKTSRLARGLPVDV